MTSYMKSLAIGAVLVVLAVAFNEGRTEFLIGSYREENTRVAIGAALMIFSVGTFYHMIKRWLP